MTARVTALPRASDRARTGVVDLAAGPTAGSVAAKITAILWAVARTADPSLTDVARQTRLSLSTTHRLLGELVRGRLLERTADGRYRLCPMPSWAAGENDERGIEEPDDVASVRRRICDVLEDLTQATGAQARFGVWRDARISYLERPRGQAHAGCRAGLRPLPPHATALGKVLLAHTHSGLLGQVLAQGLTGYTARTITTLPDLEACLVAVRERDLAMCWGESARGLGAVAKPVRGPDGLVVGALELGIDDLRDLPRARACLHIAAAGLGRVLTACPSVLPRDEAARRWRADPTSPHLAC